MSLSVHNCCQQWYFCSLWKKNLNSLHFLFSRIGLDWACTVADILHSLNVSPEWSTVIASFTDHCIQQLPQTLKRTNLFTLLVLVGFPEVRTMNEIRLWSLLPNISRLLMAFILTGVVCRNSDGVHRQRQRTARHDLVQTLHWEEPCCSGGH